MTAGLQAAFKQFGPLRIEWPGKDGKHPRYPNRGHELPGSCLSVMSSVLSIVVLCCMFCHFVMIQYDM